VNTNGSELPKAIMAGPTNDPRPQVSYTTRWQAFRAGAWHGAKFGFKAFLVIWAVIGLGAAILALVVPRIRQEAAKDLALETLTLLRILKGAGGVVVFCVAFGILYGAIPGALIVGTIEAFRWRGRTNARIMETTNTDSR